jgi:uncharacterized damage-inducible protein DinB
VSIEPGFLDEARLRFAESRSLVERAVAQLDEEQFFTTIDDESNSVAVIIKHMAGNMQSRWTDFLTTDGEKPDRHRDSEFVLDENDTRSSLLERLDRGWNLVFVTIDGLSSEDLSRTVTIRSEPHSVIGAICRQLTHYAYHAGQIVFLAKHLRSTSWQTLSVARGQSEAFTAQKREQK